MRFVENSVPIDTGIIRVAATGEGRLPTPPRSAQVYAGAKQNKEPDSERDQEPEIKPPPNPDRSDDVARELPDVATRLLKIAAAQLDAKLRARTAQRQTRPSLRTTHAEIEAFMTTFPFTRATVEAKRDLFRRLSTALNVIEQHENVAKPRLEEIRGLEADIISACSGTVGGDSTHPHERSVRLPHCG